MKVADNAPTAPKLLAFSWNLIEAIQGEPRSIRTSRLECGTGGLDRPYLQETIDFDGGKKPFERCIYHQDGRLYFRQICSYDSSGRLSEIQVSDESGVRSRTENVSFLPDGTEVREARDQSGKIVERITTKCDGEGRVFEILLVEVAGASLSTLFEVTVSYDDEGETKKHSILTKYNDGSISLFEKKAHDGREEIMVSYADSDRAPLTQLTSSGLGTSAITEQITERDQAGNWIRKEIHGPGGQREVITELSRLITY